MKQFTITINEEELMYIRMALCNQNIKTIKKIFSAKVNGSAEGYNEQMEKLEAGRRLIARLDAERNAEAE